METIKFRSSGFGHIMPGPREKAGELQDTVKTHLIDVFISKYYERREFIDGKFLEKGNQREEDSITLLSRVSKRFFKKNSERLENDYITGEPDIFIGESIREAEETIDTKTSWSLHTFHRAKHKKIDDNYFYQGHSYMWLTGAKRHTIAYCLVNGTAQAIMDEKRKQAWRYGPDPEQHPEYRERCKQIEINHIFDLQAFISENPFFEFHNNVSEWVYDIPNEDRLFTFTIERDPALLKVMEERVLVCRKWINDNLLNEVQR